MECKRCGLCCVKPVQKDCWLGSPLTWEEKQHLLAEIENKPKHDKGGCLMLWFDSEIAHCLVQDIYSYDKKEKSCQEYLCEEIK